MFSSCVVYFVSVGDPASGHTPCHDHGAGDGSRTSLPAHAAARTQLGGESADPAAHAGDQRWVHAHIT